MKIKFLISAISLALLTSAAAEEFTVTLPANAEIMLGTKTKHFLDFVPVEAIASHTDGDTRTITYDLTNSTVYNYRTWRNGGLTNAGYFTMSTDITKRPQLIFNEEDYSSHLPSEVNHDVTSNKGFETGDIFVNINPEGHLRLNIGETFTAHAMRTWQLTDNVVNNYFIEPDFRYTIIDLDGNPSEDVISVESTPASPWATITALGKGTAIVLVSYDAICLNYFSKATKKEYLGGQFWGASWPENTAAYVVTVDEPATTARPNMTINASYNEGTKKIAGEYVDAEHDVFYYLESEPGYRYTFFPEGVKNVDIAYPDIREGKVSYSGFTSEGVESATDGSYTLLLRQGRQIVRLTDDSGAATYQVLTARPCSREITNLSNPDAEIFSAGDKVKIQYSGLFHPANKLAGIYNMSAYVTYNGIPAGTSLIQNPNQYTFGSNPAAQAIELQIPSDVDPEQTPFFILDDGVIQVTGYGDPIGNHRLIDPAIGRSPNFTAVAHETYFGALPPIELPLKTIPLSINEITPTMESNLTSNIYDLSGRIVLTDGNIESIKELRPGIYILHNGTNSSLIRR